MDGLTPRSVWTNPIHFLAFGFGSGVMPFMPGTWGTLVGVLAYWFLQDLSLMAYCFSLLVVITAGVWLCDVTSKAFGGYDHPGIVWDEIAGYLLTMVAAPHGWLWLILGFLLFRLFDILKPWPIRWLERRLEGGLGIMADDLLAGLMAWAALQLTAWFLLPLFVA